MMNSSQLSLDIPMPPHYNRGLFSDYFLGEVLSSQSGWIEMENDARKVRDDLRALRDQIDLAALDEAQLEERWIKPVLRRLGHSYSVQVKIRYRETGYRKPDYVLTRTEKDAASLTSEIYKPADLRERALAVCDAKRLGSSFDQSPGWGERNPSQQIDEYLRYSELPWGILTDGQYWRLYERETSKNNLYYMVDLFDLLAREGSDFIYFYAFFRQEAFAADWLQKTLQGSTDFAQRISDQLEDQVYEALELIAQGFLDYRRNNLKPSAEVLQTIYEQSLVFLYRLLFVLYAESRGVLPLEHSHLYRTQQSLYSIKGAVKRIGIADLDADHGVYYEKLKDLFFAIDQGNPRFALPAYNGRLFSEAEHPFLAQNAVGDKYLAPAIDKMARIAILNGDNNKAFIDYRDLDVRHLGAIYEKLLEYQLEIAQGPLTLKNGKYAPAKKGDQVLKEKDELYLRTGNNERKITGSYYTPDYIVRFIVERTLEPLLTEITEHHAVRDEEGHWATHDPEGVRQSILALNILDPATGSGHFMVEVMIYLAAWLRSLSILSPEELSNGEDELAYWKRQVVNSCVYGVDINPLAVELAKLSLWLATLSQGRPLSFLDHHVKRGNSLIGAQLSQIGFAVATPAQERRARTRLGQAEEAGQWLLLDDDNFAPTVQLALEEMAEIERTLVRTVDSVKEQEERYAHLTDQMAAWRVLADVWLARYFGLSLEPGTWTALRSALLNGELNDKRLNELLEQASLIAEQHRFLHFELEFPEVFFNPDGTPKDNPGFDAVVGNPPYVRQERIKPLKQYLGLKYDIYHGTADLFLYFYEMGLRYLKRDQRLGYITSGTYMNSNSARAFRQHIHHSAAFETAINFGENQPFRGAEMVYPTIAVLRKGEPGRTFRSLFIEGTHIPESLDDALAKDGINCLSDVTAMDEWRFQSEELTELFRKITDGYVLLGDVVSGRIYRGITTGLNQAFIIDSATYDKLIYEHPLSAKILKPIIHGENLRPWYQILSDEFLIFTRQGIDIEQYPAIQRHLEKFRTQLEPKPDNWDNKVQGKWLGRKSGTYKWHEIQDTTAYHEEFEQPKIYWAEIAKLPRFSWDDQKLFASNKAHMLIPPSKAVLAFLNSRVAWFVLSQICVPLRLRAGLWQYQLTQQFVKRVPVPDLTDDQESQLAQIGEHITALSSERYLLHESMRHDIREIGQGIELNRPLREWWNLKDTMQFQREVERAETSIPVRQLAEWRDHLASQQAQHNRLTAQIVDLETRLNAIVYQAFDLDEAEIRLIEENTRYPYGAV